MEIELLNGVVNDKNVLEAFESESIQISKHYKRCCLEENIKVFLLKVEGNIVGFFGISVQMPKDPPSLEFWVLAEYIYIKEVHRKNAYSFYLLDKSGDEIEKYIIENKREGVYRLILRVDIISEGGRKIINILDRIVKSISNKHGIEYIIVSV